jgi:hypothetical protein
MAEKKKETFSEKAAIAQEEAAKFFLVNIPWESAPNPVKNSCRKRAQELFKYLDSIGIRLPDNKRLIRITGGEK